MYIYTSGTTGYPKPTIIRHARFTMGGQSLRDRARPATRATAPTRRRRSITATRTSSASRRRFTPARRSPRGASSPPAHFLDDVQPARRDRTSCTSASSAAICCASRRARAIAPTASASPPGRACGPTSGEAFVERFGIDRDHRDVRADRGQPQPDEPPRPRRLGRPLGAVHARAAQARALRLRAPAAAARRRRLPHRVPARARSASCCSRRRQATRR